MNKSKQIKRTNEVLYFIWRVKAVLIRHIEKMYFKTNVHARHYLLALEKKGYLTHTTILLPDTKPGTYSEKVYSLTYAGIKYLKKAGFEVVRYLLHSQSMHHDLVVTDILIYHIKNFDGLKEFKTDYELRREMYKRDEMFRSPDFTFEDKKGRKYLVEYQITNKSANVIKDYIADYMSYDMFKDHDVMYIVKKARVIWYEKIFKETELENWHIMTYDRRTGLKTVAEYK